MKKSFISILALSFLIIGGSICQAGATSVAYKVCAQACSTQAQSTKPACIKTCQATCNHQCTRVGYKDHHHQTCLQTCAASAVKAS